MVPRAEFHAHALEHLLHVALNYVRLWMGLPSPYYFRQFLDLVAAVELLYIYSVFSTSDLYCEAPGSFLGFMRGSSTSSGTTELV